MVLLVSDLDKAQQPKQRRGSEGRGALRPAALSGLLLAVSPFIWWPSVTEPAQWSSDAVCFLWAVMAKAMHG